ncbi:hypothetical protein ACFLWZ_02520 [Chloroflexota bacterium]
MKRFAKFSLVVGVLAIILIVAGAMNTNQVNAGDPPGQGKGTAPVTVINEETDPIPVMAPSPIPVSGSIIVAGTADVNVTNTSLPVTGTVEANITNSSLNVDANVTNSSLSVEVNNSAINPVMVSDVSASGFQPFAWEGRGQTDGFQVPADKRLVIEMVSAFSSPHNGFSEMVAVVKAVTSTATVDHQIPITTIANPIDPSNSVSTGCELVKIYADPGSWVDVRWGFFILPIDGVYAISISGYLVDVP